MPNLVDFKFQGKERDVKVTVFKKTEETYMLKMKNSREFFSAVSFLVV